MGQGFESLRGKAPEKSLVAIPSPGVLSALTKPMLGPSHLCVNS